MRFYIFTETERSMINSYFKDGTKAKDFDVLLYRIRKNYPRLKDDITLLESILDKEKSST
jgi:hypothetical protein